MHRRRVFPLGSTCCYKSIFRTTYHRINVTSEVSSMYSYTSHIINSYIKIFKKIQNVEWVFCAVWYKKYRNWILERVLYMNIHNSYNLTASVENECNNICKRLCDFIIGNKQTTNTYVWNQLCTDIMWFPFQDYFMLVFMQTHSKSLHTYFTTGGRWLFMFF